MSTTTRTPVPLDICVDCLFLIANGEGPDDVAERLAERWPNGQITLGATDCEHCPTEDGEDCEAWFSWSPCDGCGSTLGGDRHHATGWLNEL